MVKIYKSPAVYVETSKPVILDIPQLEVNLPFDNLINNINEEDSPAQTDEALAQSIVEEAKQQAEQILSEARQQAETLRHEAVKQGIESGHAKAKEALSKIQREIYAKFNDFTKELNLKYETLFETIEKEVAKLSVNIAEKIILLELDRNDQCFKNIVANAVSKLKNDENAAVRISREDYDRFSGEINSLLSQYEVDIALIRDENLQSGSCIVETSKGLIDASVNTQIKAVASGIC